MDFLYQRLLKEKAEEPEYDVVSTWVYIKMCSPVTLVLLYSDLSITLQWL